eukprot:COSAG02_NODE_1569_length_11894_cov_51.145994_9_plen_1216_part_00
MKMRANFIGLHTYNFNELTNWIGPVSNVLPNGSVTAATPGASFATSGGGTHFVGPTTTPFPTSSYFFGAAALFDTDCFCGNAEVVFDDACPVATTAESAAKAFDRAGAFQAKVFGLARSLGVTTATGVELPVAVSDSKYWPNETTVDDLYSGVLRRLVNLHTPLDYFWLWSSEGWEWGQVNVTDSKVVEGLKEFEALASANRRLGSDAFKLASAGWVLGPLSLDSYSQPDSGTSPADGGNSSTIPMAGDRLYWDKHLGSDYTAMSSIDGHVGAFRPNPGYAELSENRSGWVIPWLEDDPGITSIQFWASRVLDHAAMAAHHGADGLFGIHWRTRSLSPQFSALFQAGWNDTALPSEFAKTETEQEFETAAAADFYLTWCTAEFGGGDGVPASLVSQACKPFRYLDAQVCSGNCATLQDYPSHCGDPGISRVYGTLECLRPVAWGSTMGNAAHKPGPTGQGSPVPDPAQCETLSAGLYDFVDEFVENTGEQLKQCGKANAGVLERHRYWSDQFLSMKRTAMVDCAWSNATQVLATLRTLLASASSKGEHDHVDERHKEIVAARRAIAYNYARAHALPAYRALVTAVGDMFTSLLESTTNAGEMGVVGDLMDSKLPVILNHTNRMLIQSALELGANEDTSTVSRMLAEIEQTQVYLGRPRLFAPTLRPFVDRWPLRIRAVLLSNQTTIGGNSSNATVVTIHWREHTSQPHSQWNAAAMHPLRITSGAGGVFEGEIGTRNESNAAKSIPPSMQMVEWTLSCGELGLVFPATAPEAGHTVVLRPLNLKTDDDDDQSEVEHLVPPWTPPAKFPTNRCPCGELCKPLRHSDSRYRHKKRFFGFWATKIYNGSSDAWRHWDWKSMSTVAVWSYWEIPAANWSMFCRAHSEGVRVVVPFRGGDYHSGQILNATARHEWILNQVSELAYFDLDGTNFDVEGQYNTSRRAALTSLICETQAAQQRYLPDSTLTMDLDITPDNPTITGGYDYQALSRCLDHIVPMAYDMTGRKVGANSPLPVILDGVRRQYPALGVAPSRLIVALPWYAYSFTCSTASLDSNCSLPASIRHNTKLWEESYLQLGYGEVLDLHTEMGSPSVTYDTSAQYKWFDYTNQTTRQRHRVSFDDPETLLVKYKALLEAGVAGVGAWTIAATQRSSAAATEVASQQMWRAVTRALAVNETVPEISYDVRNALGNEASSDELSVTQWLGSLLEASGDDGRSPSV